MFFRNYKRYCASTLSRKFMLKKNFLYIQIYSLIKNLSHRTGTSLCVLENHAIQERLKWLKENLNSWIYLIVTGDKICFFKYGSEIKSASWGSITKVAESKTIASRK